MFRNKKIENIQESGNTGVDDNITPQFLHIKELAQLKYDAEEKREQGLIQQSSQMQAAFSFVTAALFMAVLICIEHRGPLELKFFLISISIIVVFLMTSLVTASLAQWRWKRKSFPDVKEMESFVLGNPDWEKNLEESYRIKQWVNLIAEVQADNARLNKRRVNFIMASMICFYCSIAVITISFIVAIIKLL